MFLKRCWAILRCAFTSPTKTSVIDFDSARVLAASPALEKYQQLETRMLSARASGDEPLEDKLLEEMDMVWYREMTNDDRLLQQGRLR